MKIYRNHYCSAVHRSYRTQAACIWKKARPAWIAGEGPYALLAWCRALTITLHTTREQAEQAKATIDAGACGGCCVRRHEIICIVKEEAKQ